MKKVFIVAFILIYNISASQKKGIVYYGFIDALQIGNANGDDYSAYLVFNTEQSYYVTAKDSLEKADKINEQKTYFNKDGGGTISNGMKVSPQGDQVVYNIKKKTMWSNFLYAKQRYVIEVTPKFNWKIENETKMIGSFKCKKATTFFRGRKYIAWFTTEIPLPYGPWKLNGLPGLILEAYDTNKFVYWYFKSVEYPTSKKIKVDNLRKAKGEKQIKYMTLTEFNEYRIEEQTRTEERQRIEQKNFPDVTFITPSLNQMFIEFE